VAHLTGGEDPASFLQSRDAAAMQAVLAESQEYLPFLMSLAEDRGGGRQVKERALRQGLKTLAMVEDPIRQEYLLQEAADIFGISLTVLRDSLQREQRAARPRQRAEPGERRESSRPAGPAPAGPQAPGEGNLGIRSFAAVNRPAIEKTLLAHVLRDESGEAARILIKEGGEHLFTSTAAVEIFRELGLWRREQPPGAALRPARFIQDRWHDKSQVYREFVSGLLTLEVIPDQTDFARVIKDCLARLDSDRRRPGSLNSRRRG
jgi:DNA primase